MRTLHYFTLEQALNQRKVVVHETSQVNELAVQNNSADAVFIQVGDIVKGGNQDRMITNDFILPPYSGKLPIDAFCVEQDRRGRRGSEPTQAHLLVQQHRLLSGSNLNRCRIRCRCGTRLWSCRRRSRPIFASRTTQPGWATFEVWFRRQAFCSRKPVHRSRRVSAYTKVEERGSLRLAGTLYFHVEEAAEVENSRGTTSGPSSKHRACRYKPSYGILKHNRHGSRTNIRVHQLTQHVQQKTPDQLRTESRDGSAWVHRSIVTK